MDFVIQVIFTLFIAGFPYFYFLKKFKDKNIFYISISSLIIASFLNIYVVNIEFSPIIIIVSIFSSIFAGYKAYKTSNLYKLSYLFIFINAPLFLLIEANYTIWYILSVVVTTSSLFNVGKYFEDKYGSPNFQSITSLTHKLPKLSFFLQLYLLSLALFPPFPNFIFLMNILVKSNMDLIVIIVFIFVFLANFFIAMNILSKTIFGKENEKIYYRRMQKEDLASHIFMLSLIISLSIYGLKEILA